MIYHLLHVSTYPEKFLRLLIKNRDSFDLNDHHFIIETNGKNLFPPEILDHINYSVTKKGWEVYRYLNGLKENDKIIVHYLGNPRHLMLFGLFPHLLRRVVWSIWGGDAYFVNYMADSYFYRFYEYLRKMIIPRIPLITCVVKGDYDFVVSRYGTTAPYMQSIYSSDVNDDFFKTFRAKNLEATANVVLVGNSADPANNHVEVLTALKSYSDVIDEILVPLMYGGSEEYVQQVTEIGQLLFGRKFRALTEFVPCADYVTILNSAKVQVFNHFHQEGLGNAFVMFALGKRVFVRGNISSFDYFKKLGIRVQDTRDLLAGGALLFEDDPVTAEANAAIMLQETSEAHLVELWSKVFAAEIH